MIGQHIMNTVQSPNMMYSSCCSTPLVENMWACVFVSRLLDVCGNCWKRSAWHNPSPSLLLRFHTVDTLTLNKNRKIKEKSLSGKTSFLKYTWTPERNDSQDIYGFYFFCKRDSVILSRIPFPKPLSFRSTPDERVAQTLMTLRFLSFFLQGAG